MLGNGIAKNGSIRRHKVDNAIRESGIPENLIDEVIRQNGGIAGFPNNAISHHSRGIGQVSGDGGEIEGGNGSNETLEGAVPHQVQSGAGVLRNGLVFQKLLAKESVESEKVKVKISIVSK